MISSSRKRDVSFAATVLSTLLWLVTLAGKVLGLLAENAVLLAGISVALALPIVAISALTAHMGMDVWDETKQVSACRNISSGPSDSNDGILSMKYLRRLAECTKHGRKDAILTPRCSIHDNRQSAGPMLSIHTRDIQ